ncbi:hypothetical protein UFOVP706_23 [uncultured Caudovirales phage]|uniref:Helix-turn-helix domain containing protein n=1 Tax=uncultured Caudovirales phage TaxID=2100421 RepID=A0A6J5NU08_9CAUD|nr:hypothetical protein UFOVP706_23 [uncultured Caudovirales phage]
MTNREVWMLAHRLFSAGQPVTSEDVETLSVSAPRSRISRRTRVVTVETHKLGSRKPVIRTLEVRT